jgi:hypothetical protein
MSQRRLILYRVVACVTHKRKGWTTSVQIPIFYLDADIQGITSDEHAKEVAKGVIDPAGVAESMSIDVMREEYNTE